MSHAAVNQILLYLLSQMQTLLGLIIIFSNLQRNFCGSGREIAAIMPHWNRPSNAVLTAPFVHLFMQEFGGGTAERICSEQCAPGFVKELEKLIDLPDVADSLA